MMDAEKQKWWDRIVSDSMAGRGNPEECTAILAVKDELDGLYGQRVKLMRENTALRSAIEWAIDRLSKATVMSISTYYVDAVIETLDELRRRTGRAG